VSVTITVANVRTQIADRPQIYPPNSASPEILGYGDGVTTQFALSFENFIPGTLTLFTAAPPAAGVAPVFAALSAAAPIAVATTVALAVTPGVQTVTPAAMTNISTGKYLRIDPGLSTQEDVLVTAVTGTTFTAVFAQSHVAGFSVIGTPAWWTGGPPSGTDNTNATNQIVYILTAPAAGTLIAARYQATAFSDSDLTNYLNNASVLYGTDNRTLLKACQFDLIDVILADQRRLTILSEGSGYRNDPSAYASNLRNLKEGLRKDLTGDPLPGRDVPALAIGIAAARGYTPYR
jgi:hypothetical protein